MAESKSEAERLYALEIQFQYLASKEDLILQNRDLRLEIRELQREVEQKHANLRESAKAENVALERRVNSFQSKAEGSLSTIKWAAIGLFGLAIILILIISILSNGAS